MKYLFGEWLPDLGPVNNPGVLDAVNVYPHPNGYRPIRETRTRSSLTAGTTVTASQVVGVRSFIDTGGRGYVYAATNSKIWGYSLASSDPFVDLSNASISSGNALIVTFAKFNNLVISASDAIVPQKSTLTNAAATTFAALGGTPPSAQHVCAIRDFVVFANTSADRALVQWSALGAPEDYVASATTQSDSQSIPDKGPILGIVGGEYGLIFFKHHIVRMTYIGSPVIFQFDDIVSGIDFLGTVANIGPQMKAMGYHAERLDDDVYFMTTAGLSVIYSGQSLRNLSKGKNAEYLSAGVTSVAGATKKTMLAVDPANTQVMVAYHSPDTSTHTLDAQVIYDRNYDRFTRASIPAAFVTSGIGTADRAGLRNNLVYLTHDTGQIAIHRSLTVTPTALPAFIESADIQPFPGQRVFVNSVRPYVEGSGAPMVEVGTRQKDNQASASFSTTVTVNGDGESPQRAAGRYFRARIHMSVDSKWSVMSGFEYTAQPDGQR